VINKKRGTHHDTCISLYPLKKSYNKLKSLLPFSLQNKIRYNFIHTAPLKRKKKLKKKEKKRIDGGLKLAMFG